ncbi:MAG: hypothetical protein AB8H47_01270 [Bacteroidia bacterium]
MNKLSIPLIVLMLCAFSLACQTAQEPKNTLSLADLYTSASQLEQPIQGMEAKPMLSKMQIHVRALQTELKNLDQRIEETQSAHRSQTGIMLTDSIFGRLINEMNALQGVMKPLCQKLEGVSLPFDVDALRKESPETEFGQPPLANQVILQQLSTDVQETERAILEAIVSHSP